MVEFEITATHKDNFNNTHEAISKYRWVQYSTAKGDDTDREIVVRWVEQGIRAYVSDRFGRKVYCSVRTSIRGVKFLQTYADGYYTDNLLSLPTF